MLMMNLFKPHVKSILDGYHNKCTCSGIIQTSFRNDVMLCGGTVRKRSVKTPNEDYCYFHMEILYVDIYKCVTCSMNIL